MRKKGNRLSHQNSVKFHISIASRAVFISLHILRSRKAFKGFLQNTYLMLEQLYLNTKTRFYTDVILLFSELFCIKNDFAKYFAKCCNLFI